MLRTRHLAALTLLGSTLALQGCFNSDNSPLAGADDVTSDEEGIQAVIFQEDTDLADPDVRWYDDDDANGPAAAPINTQRWRRELLGVEKLVNISITKPDEGVPTAEVSVQSDATGLLHLYATEGDEAVHVTKEFEDRGLRSMFFERSRTRDGTDHRGWKLVALSGVLIESEATTRAINSVRIEAGALDETITTVAELVRVSDLLRIAPDTEVRVTVDTGDATDSVYLHRRHARVRTALENNGDGTFTGRFMTNDYRGHRHFVIDVLSEATLFDDEAPYDNVAWGIPFRIAASTDAAGDEG